MDYKDMGNCYMKTEKWSEKEKSNITYSSGGLILSNSTSVAADYWLSEIYEEEIAEAHRNGEIHIHNLSMLTGYCACWSLKQLIQEGIVGASGKNTAAFPKHLSVLCNQLVNFLGTMQNEWSGAQVISSFDTCLAPFVKAEGLTYPQVKKCMEAFIYGVNTLSRQRRQTPFSSIVPDWTVPDDLAELPAMAGGKEMDFKYKECNEEMDMINKAFLEIMIEGENGGNGFGYPIPTYSVKGDMEYGNMRSMCSHLRQDLREAREQSGGALGSGESTGSVGAVTINMPRIAYLASDEKDFYKRFDKMLDLSAHSLKIKRDVIEKLLKEGLYSCTRHYLDSFDNCFSTIGLFGMKKVERNTKILKADLTNRRRQEFTEKVLNHVRQRLSGYQQEYGDLYNYVNMR